MNSRRTLPGSAADRAKALIDLWHAKRGDRALPSRKDFDVLELKPWLGVIEIVEVEHGPPMRFRYRLVGTSIVDIDGMDITGQYADEVFPDKMAGVTGEYVQAIETRGPIETQLERPNAKGFIAPYHKLVLPLSSDGDGIDMLIVLLIELERMDAPKHP